MPQWNLADRLTKALKVSPFSVAGMAEYMGVSRVTISNWINGRVHPDIRTLKLWALATGVDYGWLVNGDSPDGESADLVPPVGLEPTTHWLALAAA